MWMHAHKSGRTRPTHGNGSQWTAMEQRYLKYNAFLMVQMAQSEEFCMSRENGGYRLIGFIDNDKVNKDMTGLSCGKKEQNLATHACISIFFFPYHKTNQVIFILFVWKAVQYLYVYGFTVTFISMDGAQTNQDFLKMFCENTSPLDKKFSTINILSPSDPKITFIMDYSHVVIGKYASVTYDINIAFMGNTWSMHFNGIQIPTAYTYTES
ncbi:hypothetical protein MAR_038181 [Mya arenaria]|uniref:Uncharacterized protein n=1 Tax=Mya arenaria TaxID=6604 RepID=A0ABY7FSF3_MYAAR|nr:hypothetical protein MAR_038181 [Mya arenaria]